MICETIELLGCSTFRDDRNIDGGDDIPNAIRDAITSSTELLVLLTPESVSRTWVTMEIGAAWQRQMRIVGVRQHTALETIPKMLHSKKIIDLNEFDQ